MNIAGINLVAMLNQVSVWWHIVIVAAVVLLVFLAGKPDESGLTLFAIQPQDVGRVAGTTTSGSSTSTYGAGDHLPARRWRSSSRCSRPTGRTPGTTPRPTSPRRRSGLASPARGASSCRSPSRAVVGFVFLLALTTHLPDLSTLFPADLATATRPPTASTTSAAASRSSTSSSTTSGSWATCSPPASPSRWRSAACRRSPPPDGCSSPSAATTACRARAG